MTVLEKHPRCFVSATTLAQSLRRSAVAVACSPLEVMPKELAHLLAIYLSKRDVYRLARCSRRLFALMVQVLWQDALVDVPSSVDTDIILEVLLQRSQTYVDYISLLRTISSPLIRYPQIARASSITHLHVHVDPFFLRLLPTARLRSVSRLHIHTVDYKVRTRCAGTLKQLLDVCTHLNSLRIDQGAESLLSQSPSLETCHVKLAQLVLTVHIASHSLATLLAALIRRTRLSLRSLKLNITTCNRMSLIDPVIEAVRECTILKYFHLIPPDDALDPETHAATICRLLSATTQSCYRHLELVPTSEYSQTRYFVHLPHAILAADIEIDALTMWVPSLTSDHTLSIVRACDTSVKHLIIHSYESYPLLKLTKRIAKHYVSKDLLSTLKQASLLTHCTLPLLTPTELLCDLVQLGKFPLRELVIPIACTPFSTSMHASFSFISHIIIGIIYENALLASLRLIRWRSRAQSAGEFNLWEELSTINSTVNVMLNVEEREDISTYSIASVSLQSIQALYQKYKQTSSTNPIDISIQQKLLALAIYNPRQTKRFESFTGSEISSESALRAA